MVSRSEIDLKGSNGLEAIAVDESLNGHKSNFEEKVEEILLWVQKRVGSDQLIQAKEQFYWKTGKFFPDEPWYTNRISYFINHFVFERPLESSTELSGITPYESYKREFETEFLDKINHSIFSVLKVSENSILIKDLISKAKIKVSANNFERFDGILKSDIFQGFIFNLGDRHWMNMGIIFHPYKAYRVIRKNIKKEQKKEDFQKNLLLYQLARQQLRHQRHIHVNPKVFYTENTI